MGQVVVTVHYRLVMLLTSWMLLVMLLLLLVLVLVVTGLTVHAGSSQLAADTAWFGALCRTCTRRLLTGCIIESCHVIQ